MRTFVLREPNQYKMLVGFLDANWAACAQTGKPLTVSVTEHKTRRNIEQNKRLHALLNHVADSAWVDGKRFPMEQWKEFFKRQFIGTEEIELPDKTIIEQSISTTSLSVAECSDFIDKIIFYAIEQLGIENASTL